MLQEQLHELKKSLLAQERNRLEEDKKRHQAQIENEQRKREQQLKAQTQEPTTSDLVEKGVQLALLSQQASFRLMESMQNNMAAAMQGRMQGQMASTALPEQGEFEQLIQSLPQGHEAVGTSWKDFLAMDRTDYQQLLSLMNFSQRLTVKRLCRTARPDLAL